MSVNGKLYNLFHVAIIKGNLDIIKFLIEEVKVSLALCFCMNEA